MFYFLKNIKPSIPSDSYSQRNAEAHKYAIKFLNVVFIFRFYPKKLTTNISS